MVDYNSIYESFTDDKKSETSDSTSIKIEKTPDSGTLSDSESSRNEKKYNQQSDISEDPKYGISKPIRKIIRAKITND